MDLLRGVRGEELAREVGEVGEGELARVGAVADGEEDDVLVDYVVEGVLRAAVDGGLGFGVAGELAEDLADLAFDFGEGGFGLRGGERRNGVSLEKTDRWLDGGCVRTCSSSTEAQSMRPGESGLAGRRSGGGNRGRGRTV